MAVNEDALGMAGKALSHLERTSMKASLCILSEQLRTRLAFWGKITGLRADYLVAYAAPSDPLALPSTLYASVDGGCHWTALPSELTEEQRTFCELIRGRYIGQLTYEYKQQRDLPPEEVETMVVPPPPEAALGDEPEDADGDGDDGEEPLEAPVVEEADVEAPKPKRPKYQLVAMAESFRVTYFVQQHDGACRLAFRGSLVKQSRGVVARRLPRPISVEEATQLRSYARLRTPPEAERVNRGVFGATYSAATDFLWPVVEDRPRGVWSLKYDSSLGMAVVLNWLFEGSIAFTEVGSTEWGQYYIGTGELNLDLCFALPA